MKIPSVSKKFWIVVATIAIVTVLFAYYLLVYVKGKKEDLIARNFRALEQVGMNIGELRRNHLKTIDNNQTNCDSLNLYRQNLRFSDTIQSDYEGLDSIFFEYKYSQDCAKYIKHKTGFLSISVNDFLKKMPLALGPFFIVRVIKKESNDSKSHETNSKETNAKSCCCCEPNQQKEKKDLQVFKIVYQDNLIGTIKINNLDSLYIEDHGIKTIPATTINISGMDYLIFTHIITFDEGEEWILCKGMQVSDFEAEGRQIDAYRVVFAILIGLFILLSMPIMKLFIMNEIERLRIINVLSTGYSIVVGTALLMIILIAGVQHIGHKKKLTQNLDTLAVNIETRFLGEMSQINAQLNELSYNKVLINRLDPAKNIKKDLLISITKKKNRAFIEGGDSIEIGDHYRNFNQILLLNEKGDLITAVLSSTEDASTEAPTFSLSDREYFFKAKDESLWYLSNDSLQQGFAMQSIRSWSDAVREVGIGIPIKDTTNKGVLAIAASLPSVINTLMSPGYGFAVIDEIGNVWFHSDSEQTWQQNFLAETEFDTKLMAAVKGRMGTSIQGTYFNKPHLFYIRPLKNLPLHLITFYDLEYKDTPLVLTVTITFVLLTFMFLTLGAQLFLHFISVYQYSRLRIKRFFMNWIRPRKFLKETNASENKNNVQTYLISIGLLFVLFGFHFLLEFTRPSSNIAICFIVLPIYIYLFQYFIFENDHLWEKRKLRLRQKKARKNGKERKEEKAKASKKTSKLYVRRAIIQWQKFLIIFRHPFFYLSLLLIILVNSAFAYYIKDFWHSVFIQAGYVALLLVALFVQSTWRKNFKEDSKFLQKPVRLYFAVILLWLLTGIALPVLYLYQTAHCAEYTTWSKYLSLKVASDDYQRKRKLAQTLNVFDKASMLEEKGDYLGLWPDLIRINKGIFDADFVERERMGSSPLDSVEFLTVPPFTGLVASTKAVLGNSALDEKWSWYHQPSKHSINFKYQRESRQPQYFSFPGAQSNLWENEYIPLLVLLLGALGWLVYRVTLFSIRHIFGLGIVFDYGFKEESDRKILVGDLILDKRSDVDAPREQSSDLAVPPSTVNHSVPARKGDTLPDAFEKSGRYFIVGLPHSGKNQLIRSFLKLKKNILEIDLHSESPFLKGKKLNFDIIVVRHFEYGINDPKWNARKLSLFMKLASLYQGTIIIVSAVQPTSVLEFYETAILRENNDTLESRKLCDEYRQAIRKWKNSLSNFVTYYQPLECKSTVAPKSVTLLSSFIQSEIGYGNYLPQLRPHLNADIHEAGNWIDHHQECENIVLRVEELADLYYHSLWNSFTNDEKYLLFDLAKDRFVNLRNTKVIRILMQKGVIKADDSLQIMNQSFNNFILSTVNRDEEILMEREQERKGSWNTVYVVLVILMLGLLSFVALAQQKLFQNFTLLIGAISSALALFTRFGGLIGSTTKPKE